MLDFVNPMMGNDPELFIKSGNRLIPSESIITSKHKKVKVDNAAVELQPGPRHCLQEQNKDIASSLAVVQRILKNRELEATHVSLRPVEQLREEDIEEYRTVCMFGCQPSLVFDGEYLKRSAPTVNPRKVRYRSVGYHVHMGSDHPDDLLPFNATSYRKMCSTLHTTEGRVRLVQMCDLLVGLPAVLMERDARVPIRRKTLGYGKAGEFREQPHGFEYRTLGSWPLLHPMWGWWANAAVRDALNLTVHDLDSEIKKDIPLTKVADVINDGNLAGALEYWHLIKQRLAPIIASYEKSQGDARYLADSHPILSTDLLKRFDFLAMKRDLKNRAFNFNSWCKRKKFDGWDGTRLVAFHIGFDNGSKERVKDFEDWPEFQKSWALDKDIISKHMLA